MQAVRTERILGVDFAASLARRQAARAAREQPARKRAGKLLHLRGLVKSFLRAITQSDVLSPVKYGGNVLCASR